MGKVDRSNSGAVLIELALALPLFLALILGIIWASQLFQAQTTLTAAVGNSLRLGITRGNELEMGMDIIAAVQTYDGPTLKQLLISADLHDTLELTDYNDLGVFSVLHDSAEQPLYLQDLALHYPEFVYSLIYINATMRNSIGASVRYPCDPDPAEGEVDDGAGCLLCVFRNPYDPDPLAPYFLAEYPQLTREVAIECSYRPGGGLTKTVFNLLALASGAVGADPPVLIMRRRKAGEFM